MKIMSMSDEKSNLKLLSKDSYLFIHLIYKQLRLYVNLYVNPLSVNFTKWSNTLKQFVVNTFFIIQ